MTRFGMGYDVHRLVPGRALIIGGVVIPYDKGLLGHSDADVLLHAVTDALLGAAALGDIGRHLLPERERLVAGGNDRNRTESHFPKTCCLVLNLCVYFTTFPL